MLQQLLPLASHDLWQLLQHFSFFALNTMMEEIGLLVLPCFDLIIHYITQLPLSVPFHGKLSIHWPCLNSAFVRLSSAWGWILDIESGKLDFKVKIFLCDFLEKINVPWQKGFWHLHCLFGLKTGNFGHWDRDHNDKSTDHSFRFWSTKHTFVASFCSLKNGTWS